MTDHAQAFSLIVRQRSSLRAFLPTPVDPATLTAIFEDAARAPSNCNTQPWIVHLVSGRRLEQLRQHLPAAFAAGEMSLDFPFDGKYDGIYRQRQHASAQALYQTMGVVREDKAARQQAFMRNFSFFDAPHVALLFLPEPFGLREAADLGMFAQTLMLAITARGLGSCPQTSLSFEADLLRAELGITPQHKLLFGISFGHPDPVAVVNSCETERAAVADFVTFHD